MKRNQMIVLVDRKYEIGKKTRCVLSIFLLGMGKKMMVAGLIRKESIMTRRQGGRKEHVKHATGKAACMVPKTYLVVSTKVTVVKVSIGRKRKRRTVLQQPGIQGHIKPQGIVHLFIVPLYDVLSLTLSLYSAD